MKYATKLLLTYIFFSVLSFSIIYFSVNKAIEYYSFVTIEKQMMEKADISELTFREILTRYENSETQLTSEVLVYDVLNALKASGKEVRIYDSAQKLLGLAENGIVVKDATPRIFNKNISNAIKGNYAYTITEQHLIYFAMPIQDRYYQNAYVFEIVENISYYYEIMAKIKTILLIGSGGFIILITFSSLYIARRTTKPIKYLLRATEKFSKQQFDSVTLNRKDELGMLAAGLNQMGIKLNDAFQYQKQFISNVSHELKTPLAAIRGFSQYLYEGELNKEIADNTDNTDNAEDLNKIYFHLVNESNRLTVLIEELLLLSKFDKTTDTFALEKVDLTELTHGVIHDMLIQLEKRSLTIDTDLGTGVFAFVNKTLMAHAISNILDNAIKYSNKGGSIKIETTIVNENAIIKITDQGIGIHKNELPLVQDRFYRAVNSNFAKGSGLGLSLCSEIVEKFKGQIIIESELGIGTTVSILLPKI